MPAKPAAGSTKTAPLKGVYTLNPTKMVFKLGSKQARAQVAPRKTK
jgi:hypothetical protein